MLCKGLAQVSPVRQGSSTQNNWRIATSLGSLRMIQMSIGMPLVPDKGGKPVIGGDKSVNCEGFTTKSCPADVKRALDEARAAKNIARAKALQRLWKVMRRLRNINMYWLFLEFLELELQQGACGGTYEA